MCRCGVRPGAPPPHLRSTSRPRPVPPSCARRPPCGSRHGLWTCAPRRRHRHTERSVGREAADGTADGSGGDTALDAAPTHRPGPRVEDTVTGQGHPDRRTRRPAADAASPAGAPNGPSRPARASPAASASVPAGRAPAPPGLGPSRRPRRRLPGDPLARRGGGHLRRGHALPDPHRRRGPGRGARHRGRRRGRPVARGPPRHRVAAVCAEEGRQGARELAADLPERPHRRPAARPRLRGPPPRPHHPAEPRRPGRHRRTAGGRRRASWRTRRGCAASPSFTSTSTTPRCAACSPDAATASSTPRTTTGSPCRAAASRSTPPGSAPTVAAGSAPNAVPCAMRASGSRRRRSTPRTFPASRSWRRPCSASTG